MTNFNFDLFTFNDKTYAHNGTRYTEDGKLIKKADYTAIAIEAKTEFDLTQAQENPAPETSEEPAEKKERKHPTADKFLETIPEGYIFRTNAKGHILISKAEGDKTAYARIRPLKDGAYIFPGKELKATRSDWEYHQGWANEYALKVATWDAIDKVLFPKEEPAQA